jgi:FAD-dependent urate hydroxylase
MAKLARILIVGGGIAGLTVATSLRQRGFRPELVELTAAWHVVGGGIAIQPNAIRALRTLGMGDAVVQAGARIGRFVFCTQKGETLSAIDVEALWGESVIGVDRARLRQVLLRGAEGVPWRLATWITSLEQRDGSVSVAFNDGTAAQYDLVIGADGIASTLRKMAIGPVAPLYAGHMAWRMLAPFGSDRLASVQFWLGDGCMLGLFPVGEGRTYCSCNLTGPRFHEPEDGRLARLRERFAGFGAPIHALLAAVHDDAQVHCGPIESLELDRWHDGRVVLIGDAAHASSPMMGQGGCMAIEDALVLAESLSTSDSVEAALDAYVTRRRPRVDWVQQQSRIVGQSVLLPPGVRDGVLRERGETMFKERYAPLLAPP